MALGIPDEARGRGRPDRAPGHIEHGTNVDANRITLEEFLNGRWLPVIQSGLAASTYDSYARNVRLHIIPELGSVPVQALTAADLTAFYGERPRKGRLTMGHEGGRLSARTVRYLHAILHRALGDAMRWGIVIRNVADAAEPPSPKSAKAPTPKTWTADELRAFLVSVRDDRLYALWLVYATTGLRRGETLALHWRDVDLEHGRLAIRAASISIAHAVTESTPKSARGKRSVAIDRATIEVLRAHRKRQLEERMAIGPDAYSDEGLVFAKEDGTRMHPERATRSFASRVRASGQPTIRLHDLRHRHRWRYRPA